MNVETERETLSLIGRTEMVNSVDFLPVVMADKTTVLFSRKGNSQIMHVTWSTTSCQRPSCFSQTWMARKELPIRVMALELYSRRAFINTDTYLMRDESD